MQLFTDFFSKTTKKEYTEQSGLEVAFKCSNGTVYCHKSVLSLVSDFFRVKINASERMNNLLEFDYGDFDKETIQLYLDTIYKIDSISMLNPPEKIFKLLKLAEFLKWEGKNMVSGTVLGFS